MPVDLKIQFERVVRAALVATTCVCVSIFSGSDTQAQTSTRPFAGRYPLLVQPEHVDSSQTNNVEPDQRLNKPNHPTIEKTLATAAAEKPNQSSDLSESLESTRAQFSKQFEQAYAHVTSSQPISPKTVSQNNSAPTRDRSVVFIQNVQDQIASAVPTGRPPNISPASVNFPVVTPLPLLDDATNHSPQLADTKSDLGVQGLTNYPLNSTSSPKTEENDPDSTLKSESLNWWNDLVTQPLHPENQVQTVDSNGLVYMALQNSPRIQSLSRDPLIRDFEVIEADAAFDAVSFLQSQFADRSDPIGGALDATRDGLSTIENHRWTAEGGIRKQTRTGASYELSQRLGFENSNVSVFNPNNQGTAQLALNVTQPLGRGRGRYIAQSQILLAQSRGGVAWETFSVDLQAEIEEVVTGYWQLYYDRSVFLQTKRNVERAAKILATLEGRSKLDSLPNQITRARSSVQTRKTELANTFRDVRNSETELRRLIADRNWRANQFIELLPIEPPVNSILDISLDHVVTTSLENRPEIRASLQEAKLAGIERDISVNDLLPELSLLLGTYVSTLVDDGRVGEAFVDQFGETKPGYSVGLEFELPIGNRRARSRLVQRKLQLAKIKNRVDETIQDVIAGSQTALRRVNSAAQTLQAANQAIKAARSDLQQNILRWENFALVEGDFSDGQTPTTVLDQLLDSQERLSAAEMVAAQSQLELKISEVALQRSMGTLLIQKQINPQRSFEGGTPKIRF